MQPTTRSGGRPRAIAPIGKTWMNGSRLQVRFMGGTPAQKNTVREQAGWWAQHANLTFDFNDAPGADIRITFDPQLGAWSYVGTDCRSIPLNQATMNLGFLDGGTTAHEFGHAIGLAHEHQNPAGGIQWNEEVVIRELAGPPNFWDEAKARHNVLRKYSADQVNGTKFDPDSIMLYFFPAEWTLNGIATKANEVLSALDKSFIAGAKMYPKTGPTVDAPTELTVNATRRTAASIGKFGEADLFAFQVKKAGPARDRHQGQHRRRAAAVRTGQPDGADCGRRRQRFRVQRADRGQPRRRPLLRSGAAPKPRQRQGQLHRGGVACLIAAEKLLDQCQPSVQGTERDPAT